MSTRHRHVKQPDRPDTPVGPGPQTRATVVEPTATHPSQPARSDGWSSSRRALLRPLPPSILPPPLPQHARSPHDHSWLASGTPPLLLDDRCTFPLGDVLGPLSRRRCASPLPWPWCSLKRLGQLPLRTGRRRRAQRGVFASFGRRFCARGLARRPAPGLLLGSLYGH